MRPLVLPSSLPWRSLLPLCAACVPAPLLIGCPPPPNPDPACTELGFADLDEDGWGDADAPVELCSGDSLAAERAGDCNDTSGTIFPGATERCNGADDDCDGEVDEAASDVRTWHPDVDEDGHGDAETSQTQCTAPEGWVADALDCDDDDPNVGPPSTVYTDADGDGYGADATATTACPTGVLVSEGGDCDDSDPGIHPGAPDRCDGADTDCDGNRDEYAVLPDDDVLPQEAIDAAPEGATVCFRDGQFGPFVLTDRVLTLAATGDRTFLVGGVDDDDDDDDDGDDDDDDDDDDPAEDPDAGRRPLTIVGGRVTIRDVIVRGGSATDGGGIAIDGGDHVLQRVALWENTATGRGGGLFATGANLSLRGVLAERNTAFQGGGIYVEGGFVEIDGATTRRNTAGIGTPSETRPFALGAGIGLVDTAMDVAYVRSESDRLQGSFGAGGGLFLDGSGTVQHLIIVDASAPAEPFGAALAAFSTVSVSQASVHRVACTDDGTPGQDGGCAIHVDDEARLTNVSVSDVSGPFPAVRVQGEEHDGLNVWGAEGEALLIAGSQGPDLLELDPQYEDVTHGFVERWDLRLQASSGLIDAGLITVMDADGTRSDVGAYGGPGGAGWAP